MIMVFPGSRNFSTVVVNHCGRPNALSCLRVAITRANGREPVCALVLKRDEQEERKKNADLSRRIFVFYFSPFILFYLQIYYAQQDAPHSLYEFSGCNTSKTQTTPTCYENNKYYFRLTIALLVVHCF